MVERNTGLRVLSHLMMVLGILIVAFPLYLAFVASSHTAQDIVQVPMPLLPGDNLVQTYTAALLGGGSGGGSSAPVARMMWVSLVTALGIAELEGGPGGVYAQSQFAMLVEPGPLFRGERQGLGRNGPECQPKRQ